ncbi:39S ribosomal protein L16, mitochondrial [Elysia marginata]|uniref:Large ribosomal subunit protein uL16m n=1 Tax=Elysia marginata TaxID=1093978 RepID=A0AAV4FJ33_9GAST|nr:39S ribosomal protein L16, mitochondrial [Elysia marginata]
MNVLTKSIGRGVHLLPDVASLGSQSLITSLRLFSVTAPVSAIKLRYPKNYDHVKFPERRRLRIIDKIPHMETGIRPPKMPKDLYMMRGPELVHNKLQYGDYGIQAITGGRLNHKQTETIRMLVVRQMDDRRMFAIWRFNQLWQSVTKKGQGRRMGGGKGAIDHYVFPFRAERILLEIGVESWERVFVSAWIVSRPEVFECQGVLGTSCDFSCYVLNGFDLVNTERNLDIDFTRSATSPMCDTSMDSGTLIGSVAHTHGCTLDTLGANCGAHSNFIFAVRPGKFE